jgi:hypothetical protein
MPASRKNEKYEKTKTRGPLAMIAALFARRTHPGSGTTAESERRKYLS